jgi:hypothetical protein
MPSPAANPLLSKLMPQPAGLGGLSAPQGNAGSVAQAMLTVRSIIKQLEEVLPGIPMESPLHEKVLSSVKGLLSAMPDENPDIAGPQSMALLNVLRQSSMNAPTQMLARLGGGAGAPSPAAPMGAS